MVLPFTDGWLYLMVTVVAPTFWETVAGGLGRLDLSVCASTLNPVNNKIMVIPDKSMCFMFQ
jgi:hypothetical protein